MDYSRYCSLTYDGKLLDQILDGYMTVNVEGRGLINRVIQTVDIPGRDGSYVLGQKLPPRNLRVEFLLKGDNAKNHLERLNKLHDALKTDGDVVIQFGDEEHYRFGRLTEVQNPPYDQHQGIGSFSLYCQDPYKYKDIPSVIGTSILIPGTSIYPYRIKSITMTLTSNRTGLTITNSTTGRKIILTGSFTSGQVVQILPEDGKILLNGQNIMNRLDFILSDWRTFEINPGDTITSPVSMTIALSERQL